MRKNGSIQPFQYLSHKVIKGLFSLHFTYMVYQNEKDEKQKANYMALLVKQYDGISKEVKVTLPEILKAFQGADQWKLALELLRIREKAE